MLGTQILEVYTPMRILEAGKYSDIHRVLNLELNQIISLQSVEGQLKSLLDTCHGIEVLFRFPNFLCGVVWMGT